MIGQAENGIAEVDTKTWIQFYASHWMFLSFSRSKTPMEFFDINFLKFMDK